MRLLVFFLICYSSGALGQTIPWAIQQPKWVFPIYAKDATGKRDTIYYSYDPTASNSPYDNPDLGEQWVLPDTDFCMGTHYSYTTTFDSIIKVSARNDTYLGGEIQLIQAVFPVTFYWDVNLLHSDSLPYPSQAVFPNAWVGIGYGNGTYAVANDTNFSCNISWPVVLTDTVDKGYCPCHVRDSLVLNDWTGNPFPQDNYFFIAIDPWHQCSMGVDEIPSQLIEIFPNPTNDLVYLSYKSDLKLVQYKIINLLGKTCGEGLFDGKEINLSHLNDGMYYLQLYQNDRNYIFSKPLIKQ